MQDSGWVCGSLSSDDSTVLHLGHNRKVTVTVGIVSHRREAGVAGELH